MVRKLPWAVDSDTKKSNKRSSSDASSPALPSKRNKRDASPSSDLGLVDEDLNPIIPSNPKRHRALQNPNKSPSTSPPPAPPPVSYMREGFAADDQWMMVEDEFLATAKLYTQHLHHAAYAEAKRRAAARGQDTLRGLQRERDGRTEQNPQTKIKLEAKKGRGKMVEGDDEEVESEDEWLDPQLAVLMNSRQESVQLGKESRRLGKARRKTRAANGFLRSPEKAKRYKDASVRGSAAKTAMNGRHAVTDQQDEDSGDSDDLDGPVRSKPVRKAAKAIAEPVTKATSTNRAPASANRDSKSTGLFKRFTAASSPTDDAQESSNASTSGVLKQDKPVKREETASKSADIFTTSDYGMFGTSTTSKDSVAEWLAKKKAAKEKRVQEEKRHSSGGTNGKSSATKPKGKDYGDVPTFLI